LGDAVDQGLVKAVGVSNYNEKRLRAAFNQLANRGVPLASNQVHYSLLYRLPEENGVKRTCDELGITLIAYSPLSQGILSGKYTAANPPSGPRGRTFNAAFLAKVAPLLSKMKEIGQRYDKSSTQVALNWLVAQGNVVPIPGAKTAAQASEFAGALGWELSRDEERELHTIARNVQPIQGFPAENF
jgi:aryl-alcohol dehydrogenase-like predicted oxidoreductase